MTENSPWPEMAIRGMFDKRASSTEANSSRNLEDRIDRLSLVCMAMWSLLQDKTDLSEHDLLERVRVIDLMDGNEDGKATRTVSKCSACNRTMSQRHQRCMYCGADKLVSSAFDKI
ncbi:hypothetical protein KS4_18990 [Poriferisphaera corsica]|uniref:Uncharacterized protein n=1 Tax=Poriferisphaera corsica TaxID=2528020 RepID=A0A517YUE0_9BACT|nr:hypothetical protein [Poriferisphaera corsica]QDU33841.1 hypothetical protein KS4_18990 [Poriferisphaera corsica]